MNHQHPQPATTNPVPPPRIISQTVMQEHLHQGDAVTLSEIDRFRMFVRYDDTWWIRGADIFLEISDAQQNHTLDRWHRRLTQGSLWG